MAKTTLPFPDLSSKLPAEEQAALRMISITELPTWARARGEEYKRRIKELEKHVATFHTFQNTSAPISRLPNEVLGAIFAAGVCGIQVEDEEELPHPHRSIAGVCRRWKDVLLSTPMFWARWIPIITSAFPFWYDEDLSFAIKRSGAIPLSLYISDKSCLSVLAAHPGRITQLYLRGTADVVAVQEFMNSGCLMNLHSAEITLYGPHRAIFALDDGALPALRSLIRHGDLPITPQAVVGSLETLELVGVSLDLGEFHKVLERCPRLQVLVLKYIETRDEPDNSTGHHGPKVALQELAIDCPELAGRLLLYFSASIRAGFIVLVLVHSWPHAFPPDLSLWSHEPSNGTSLGPPCMFDRLCLREPQFSDGCSIGGYSRSTERLRYSSVVKTAEYHLEPLIPDFFHTPTVSVLVLDRQSEYESNEVRYGSFIEKLPHIRRIELPYRAVEALSFAASFLRFHADIAGDLSIAWVLGVKRGEAGLARVAEDLEGLLSLLRQHLDDGKPRLGRLELYAIRVWSGLKRKPYAGRIDEGTDGVLCREVVGPFLSRLGEVADVVVLG